MSAKCKHRYTNEWVMDPQPELNGEMRRVRVCHLCGHTLYSPVADVTIARRLFRTAVLWSQWISLRGRQLFNRGAKPSDLNKKGYRHGRP